MDRLSQRERVVLAVALAFLVAAAGAYGLVLPARAQYQAAQQRLATSGRQLDDTRQLASVRTHDRLRQANLFLPEQAAVFPTELARMANAAQVTLASVTAQKPRKFEPEGPPPAAAGSPGAAGDDLYVQKVSMRVDGSYDGVRRFLRAVETRRPSVLLDAVGVKLKGTDGDTLSAELSAELHILQSSAATPAPTTTVAVAPPSDAAASPFARGGAAEDAESVETGRAKRPAIPEPEAPPAAAEPRIELPPHVPSPGAEATAEEPAPTVEQPPPEPVIVLRGTIADEHGGLALISIDGERHTYKTGEFITPKARLLRVGPQRATIGVIKEKGKPGERVLVRVGGRITGLAMAEPSEADQDDNGLPQVVSVVAGGRGRLAILTQEGHTVLVRTGDRIPGGDYAVERIDDQGVVVSDGKTHRRLLFHRAAASKGTGGGDLSGQPSAPGGS